MVQDRLNGLALMNAPREMKLDLKQIYLLIYILGEWEWKRFLMNNFVPDSH